MWRLKRVPWKIGVASGSMLLLLLLLTRSRVSAEDSRKGAWGFSKQDIVAVQATPTEDATVAALNKEKLVQEVQQLKNQNEAGLFGWFQTNASILISTLIVVIGGLIGYFRWLADRRNEREIRAEERFQRVVTGLGDDKEGAKIGAAILLRTFLHPDYKKFHIQTFDLAVANLRFPRTLHLPEDAHTLSPPTTLSQALIVVFKEAFPLVRNQNQGAPQSLDATAVQLDDAYLSDVDLINAWMPKASLRKVDLTKAKLNAARLGGTNIENALFLNETNLRGVNGLTKEQLETCKEKGAIFDEDLTTNSS